MASVVHEPSGLESFEPRGATSRAGSSLLATGLLAAPGGSNRGLRADSTLDSSLLAVSWRVLGGSSRLVNNSRNGSYRLKNLEAGAPAAGDVNAMMLCCFAMGIPGSVRLILGNKGESPGMGRRGQVLTRCYFSSVVIYSLCDQAGEQDVAVACFYFDFAAKTEQLPTSMLGVLLKQVVVGLGEVPSEIAKPYEDQKKVIGGRAPRLSDIVKMLQTTSSEKRTFICIDALDECAAEYRVKLLNSLNQILQKSPGTRIFVTGRPHIQDEVRKRLSGRVTIIRITPRRSDIMRYLHSKLDEDTTPDAMDGSPEADILRKIPEEISEMYVEDTLEPA